MSEVERWRVLGVLGVALAGLPGVGMAATAFTDRASWAASLAGPLSVETFDDAIPTADSVTFGNGIVAKKSSYGAPPTLNRVAFGGYDGFVARDGFRSITWTLPEPVRGIGADFTGGSSGFRSLSVTARFKGGGRETFSIAEGLAEGDGFFGLSSARALTSLRFTTDAGRVLVPGGAPVGGQLFGADNLTVAPVPLPGGLALMLGAFGLGGAFAVWRRRAPVGVTVA